MKRSFLKNRRQGSIMGATLIEMFVVILISTIAISGLVTALADSITYLKHETDKMVLHNESSAALRTITQAITYAFFVDTRTAYNSPSDFLFTRTWSERGSGYDEREFYYYSEDKSLRWNDRSGDVGRFNQRLIPMFDYTERPEDDPYITVEELTFTPIDPIRPTNPTLEGYALIKIDMKLRGPRGDSLMVSTAISKLNVAQAAQ